MAERTNPFSRKSDKSLPTLVSELWQLLLGYLKQETLEPLKGLLRFVLWGVLGALLLAIGLVLLGLAGLRALQVETAPHWTGSWSWLPYLITLVGVVAVTIVVVTRIGAASRKGGK